MTSSASATVAPPALSQDDAGPLADIELTKAKKFLSMAKKQIDFLKTKLAKSESRVKSLEALEAKNKRLVEIAKKQQENINSLKSNLIAAEKSQQSVLNYSFVESDGESDEENLVSTETEHSIVSIKFRIQVKDYILWVIEISNGDYECLSELSVSNKYGEVSSSLDIPPVLLLENILEYSRTNGINNITDELDLKQKQQQMNLLLEENAKLKLNFTRTAEILEQNKTMKERLSDLLVTDMKQKKYIETLLNTIEKHKEKQKDEVIIECSSETINDVAQLESMKKELATKQKLVEEKTSDHEKLKTEFFSCLQFLADAIDDGGNTNKAIKLDRKVTEQDIEEARSRVIQLLMGKSKRMAVRSKFSFF